MAACRSRCRLARPGSASWVPWCCGSSVCCCGRARRHAGPPLARATLSTRGGRRGRGWLGVESERPPQRSVLLRPAGRAVAAAVAVIVMADGASPSALSSRPPAVAGGRLVQRLGQHRPGCGHGLPAGARPAVWAGGLAAARRRLRANGRTAWTR